MMKGIGCMGDYYYYVIELQMGFLPIGRGTTIRHNTQKYTYHAK
jgi:hypothetical protein